MVRFMSFSSGSCGNCYYLGDGTRGILIDAGVSLRSLKRNLAAEGLSFDSFGCILVTHDHLDHIRHLGAYCRKLYKPVYATRILHNALAHHSFTAADIGGCRKFLEDGSWNEIGDFLVHCFEVPHDATQTLGYAIVFEGHKFVIMTDIGKMTEEALGFASKADTVVIESNYDVDMLLGGSYAHLLKMRISEGHGHLSNDECAAAIRQFLHPGLKNIFLCHLSANNNTPKLAYDCSARVIEKGTSLRCLPRSTPSPLFYL